MSENTKKSKWERTSVTNLLRNGASGNYYARVKVNGKQKWRSLKTKVFTVAKLKVVDAETTLRTQGRLAKGRNFEGADDETKVAFYIKCFSAKLDNDSTLKESSRSRTKDSIKTLVKTWPDLPTTDVRDVTEADCRAWAKRALKEGTGFIAPNAKTVRKGMSVSNYNKCVMALWGILDVAVENGIVAENVSYAIDRKAPTPRVFDLPSVAQFNQIVKLMAKAGSRWSTDAADLASLLAYTGARLREATKLQWSHLNAAETLLTVPGTKSAASVNRPVPVFKKLKVLLERIRKRRGTEPRSAPIAGVGSCLDALKNACRKVDVKPMTHHDLRHFFATRCIESGVDIPTVSRWLGHSDGGALAMRTYGHLRQEHSLAQAAKVSF